MSHRAQHLINHPEVGIDVRLLVWEMEQKAAFDQQLLRQVAEAAARLYAWLMPAGVADDDRGEAVAKGLRQWLDAAGIAIPPPEGRATPPRGPVRTNAVSLPLTAWLYLCLQHVDLAMDARLGTALNADGLANWTVCPECRVDDFTHVQGCALSGAAERELP